MNNYFFKSNIWYDADMIKVRIPDEWELVTCNIKGQNLPRLPNKKIVEILGDPIGAPRIRDAAKGKNSVIIIFDDMTRPTPVKQIVKIILKELKNAGIPDKSISFMMAQGAHRAHTRYDYIKKLGEDIVDRYPVFSHNPFKNCIFLGTTRFGTPVEINADVMRADYKIGIGGIVPHPQMGFSGGGKIILPGVSSIKSIRKNHCLYKNIITGIRSISTRWGITEENASILDVEDAVRMAKLDFKVDAIFNTFGEICNIYCGDPIYEYHKGIKEAEKHYLTRQAKNADVVICNAYCKASEAGLVLRKETTESLKKTGGDFIVIYNTPEGLAPHYLDGLWGIGNYGGWNWVREKSLPEKVKQLIVFTKTIDRGGSWWFGPEDKINWVKEWNDVCNLIGPGFKKVVIYPDATIQLIR